MSLMLYHFPPILADQVSSHNVEHLAICARFVDGNRDVREEFLTFLILDRIINKQIALTILTFLEDNHVPVSNMRGKGGYDCAS